MAWPVVVLDRLNLDIGMGKTDLVDALGIIKDKEELEC
jgi:hypothetical protein